jgi:hypothetical protein
MRKTLSFLVILTAVSIASIAHAETVRGKIVYPDGVTPHVNVAVTLESAGSGRSGTVYSGSDGMFYLENVPPGQYSMEIKSPNETRTVPVVVARKDVNDVAPVAVK